MKYLITVLTALMSVPAFAGEPALICTRGEMGHDNYLEVAISKSKIKYTLHETSFALTRDKVNHAGHSYSILEVPVTVSAEGEQAVQTIDSLIVYHPAAKTITLTLLVDGFNVVSAELLECAK